MSMLSDATTILFFPVRRCSRCAEKKPITEFHRSSRGHQPWCRQCRREYDREYHRRRRPIRLAQQKTRHQQIWAWYLDLKRDKPCADCGRSFPSSAMQFDHLPGTAKVSEVSTLVRRRYGKRTILAEMRSANSCAQIVMQYAHRRDGA